VFSVAYKPLTLATLLPIPGVPLEAPKLLVATQRGRKPTAPWEQHPPEHDWIALSRAESFLEMSKKEEL
jgi:hypothetical protein